MASSSTGLLSGQKGKYNTFDEETTKDNAAGGREANSQAGQGPLEAHGPLIDHKIPQDNTVDAYPDLPWSKIRSSLKEPFAEFWGTFILVVFGDAAIAQVVLSNGAKGDWQSINWGWGIGILIGCYTAGISGAHLNPAVTLTNAVFRRFPWRKVVPYWIAQVLGAAVASAVVYANYLSAINIFEGGSKIRTVPGYSDTATAGIFCTYPAPFMTTTGMFFDEFLASALLMFSIYALKDDGNIGAGNLTPLGLFFIIFGIGACFGWETGYAINLARDFGPRLVSYLLGYGKEVWTAGNYYFWVPMFAPFFGCTFGAWMYDTFMWTGDSPVNTPEGGFNRLLTSIKKTSDQEHTQV